MRDPRSNKTRYRARDQTTRIQQRSSQSQLFPCIPAGEEEQTAWEVGGLHKSETETNGDHAAEGGCCSGAGGDDAPDYHCCGEVDGGFANFVEEEV